MLQPAVFSIDKTLKIPIAATVSPAVSTLPHCRSSSRGVWESQLSEGYHRVKAGSQLQLQAGDRRDGSGTMLRCKDS